MPPPGFLPLISFASAPPCHVSLRCSCLSCLSFRCFISFIVFLPPQQPPSPPFPGDSQFEKYQNKTARATFGKQYYFRELRKTRNLSKHPPALPPPWRPQIQKHPKAARATFENRCYFLKIRKNPKAQQPCPCSPPGEGGGCGVPEARPGPDPTAPQNHTRKSPRGVGEHPPSTRTKQDPPDTREGEDNPPPDVEHRTPRAKPRGRKQPRKEENNENTGNML